MVPLLERHLDFSRRGITTDVFHSGGVYPQPNHGHAEEVANIHICLRGACGLLHGPLYCHPFSPEAHFPIIHVSLTATPGDPQIDLRWPVWGCHPSLLAIPIWEPPVPPTIGHHHGSSHPWLVPSWSHCPGWACCGEVGYPPHTLNMCLSTRWVTTPHSNIVLYLPTLLG